MRLFFFLVFFFSQVLAAVAGLEGPYKTPSGGTSSVAHTRKHPHHEGAAFFPS